MHSRFEGDAIEPPGYRDGQTVRFAALDNKHEGRGLITHNGPILTRSGKVVGVYVVELWELNGEPITHDASDPQIILVGEGEIVELIGEVDAGGHSETMREVPPTESEQ